MKEPAMLHSHTPEISGTLLSLFAGLMTPLGWFALDWFNLHIPTWVVSGAGAATVGFFVSLGWKVLLRYLDRRKVLPSILKDDKDK